MPEDTHPVLVPERAVGVGRDYKFPAAARCATLCPAKTYETTAEAI